MMLLAILAAAGVGIFVTDFGRREALVCGGIAASLTLVYFLRPLTMT
jgi:hypothetical protein